MQAVLSSIADRLRAGFLLVDLDAAEAGQNVGHPRRAPDGLRLSFVRICTVSRKLRQAGSSWRRDRATTRTRLPPS